MRLRVTAAQILMLLNALAWCLLVVVRPPLSPRYFAQRDPRLNGGSLLITSGDPMMVVAKRPLFSWSRHHGGEHAAVKTLEAINIVPMFYAFVASLLLRVLPMKLVTQSYILLLVVLALTTLQWWGVGRLLMHLQHVRKRGV